MPLAILQSATFGLALFVLLETASAKCAQFRFQVNCPPPPFERGDPAMSGTRKDRKIVLAPLRVTVGVGS